MKPVDLVELQECAHLGYEVLKEYWDTLGVIPCSCPQLIPTQVNLTLAVHRLDDCRLWPVRRALLAQAKHLHINTVDHSPERYTITFKSYPRNLTFDVPLSNQQSQWTDFELLKLYLGA